MYRTKVPHGAIKINDNILLNSIKEEMERSKQQEVGWMGVVIFIHLLVLDFHLRGCHFE